jgi:phosphohistidine phosphatase SixA
MKNLSSLVCSLFIIFLCNSCSYCIYVTRHAEKASEPVKDPVLTTEGNLRAERLSKMLQGKKIEKIYSTNTVRTKKTAEPLAILEKHSISIYDPNKPDLLFSEIKNLRKNSLVVGHSNTLRHIVNSLSSTDSLKTDLSDNEYDKLFIIKRSAFKRPQLKIETY